MNNRPVLNIYWRKDELFSRQQIILNAWAGSDRNKELIKTFQNHLFSNGCKEFRVSKLTWIMRNICDIAGLNLDSLHKYDMERIISEIGRNIKYAQSTKNDYKKGLKQFFKWFEDEDLRLNSKDENIRLEAVRAYKYLKGLSIKNFIKEHDPGNVISEDEIQSIISKGCNSEMERAFIILLHETGCRIGEFLNIRIKDIEQGESVWMVNVNGKTGERPIPFIKAIPYILKWLDNHPSKDNDDYLWASLNARFRGEPLRHVGAKRLLDRCFKRAGINKPHNPHWFRHSRSSIDAPNYNEATMCKLRGWQIGSTQVRRYTHLSGKQVLEAFKKVNGVEKSEEVKSIKQQKCICGRINEPTAKYCSACGKALNIQTALLEQEYLKQAFELYGKIMKDPELRKKFEKYKNINVTNSINH